MIMDRNKAAHELLVFYQEAGVDALLDESAANRFAEPDQPAKPAAIADAPPLPAPPRAVTPPAASVSNTPLAPPAPEAAVMAAREAARSAPDLEALRQILDRFEGCGLRASATRLVFADGDPSARVMLIGEAPGRDEDIEGRPFVGRAGQLLDRMLAAIGMGRDSPTAPVYITNILPWRPPQNRDPSPDEIAMLLPFVERHITLVDPALIVLMGNTPCAALLGRRGITGMRGKWQTVLNRPAMPMFHPAYLLRTPHAKREAWADLLAIQARLREV